MGEFHDAVTTLLEAFARGITVIKRKKELDTTHKVADRHLSKSFRKSRSEIRDTYKQDLARYGPGYAVGDEEAYSSLAAILFRLNAGFVSVIERFTRGRSTQTDYTALMNLSNASRLEAIQTFSRLSQRLSKSSIALVPSEKHAHRRKHSKSSTISANKTKHARSRNADVHGVNATGWVRPKTNQKASSSSSSSTKSPGIKTPPEISQPRAIKNLLTSPSSVSPHLSLSTTSPHFISQRSPSLPPYSKTEKTEKRKSIMSFASDSTKLGEIPEHKWARQAAFGEGAFQSRTCYPLEPYQEPEKQRSRLRKLFRR